MPHYPHNDPGLVRYPYQKPESMRGKTLSEVSSGTLKWYAENGYDDYICTACSDEWNFRENNNCHKYQET